ncbi:MAG: hypothetical protein ACXVR9_14085 [Gaiellaceae bacterium]
MKLRLVSTCVLVLGIAALASASAVAGNGNGQGNGKGNGKDDSAAAPAAVADTSQGHGNSANAPGQLKKDEAAAPTVAAPTVADATQQVSSAQSGVKPSNDTAHDTHAAASSDETKLYGNGKTAGQIAQRNGAAPSTVLHGPGNSQPHKASPCAGGHEVDVHALKGKRGGSCGNTSPSPHPTPNPVVTPDPGKNPDPAKNSDPAKAPTSGPSLTPAVTPAGRVVISGMVSVTKVTKKHRARGRSASGTLAATGAVGRGTLPFTGVDLWSTAFVALTLMLIGLALCQRARSLPAHESERGARP